MNGEYTSADSFYRKKAEKSFIICADGAYNKLAELGIKPDVVLGDMDSINRKITGDAKNITYPSDKDETDGELAMNYAMGKNPSEILIFGALGGRKDQELANIFLLCKYPLMNIKIFEKNAGIWIAKKKEYFDVKKGQTVSLIPISAKVTGIKTDGLKYRLNNETLYMKKTRGISNVAEKNKIKIIYKKGMLLVVVQSRHIKPRRTEIKNSSLK